MNKNIIKTIGIGILTTMAIFAFNSCEIQEDFNYKKSNTSGPLGISAWEYIESHDSLTLLSEAIMIADLKTYYEQQDERTFIAPTNAAFKTYLEENAYESLDQIPVPILRNILRYHIVNSPVNFNNPDLMESNKPIAYETVNGQVIYLSHNTNYTGLVNQGTNRQWEITTSNLEATNGVIHVVPAIVYFSALTGDINAPDPSIKRDTIFPLHDAYINGGAKKDDNFGTDPLLRVKNVTGDGDYDRKSFLMFDLNEFDKEGVITDLQFEIAIRFTHGKGVDLDLYSVQDTLWAETDLTWNTATFPENDPIASLITSKTESFNFNITDHFLDMENLGKLTLMLDGQAGSNETDDLASKENTDYNMPMLIATLASGNSVLTIENNSGFAVESEGTVVLKTDNLLIEGAAPQDVIYTIEEAPNHGWLIKGANVLKEGDQFTQLDIDVMNLLYINDGSGDQDMIKLSAKDRAGARLDAFDVEILIQ